LASPEDSKLKAGGPSVGDSDPGGAGELGRGMGAPARSSVVSHAVIVSPIATAASAHRVDRDIKNRSLALIAGSRW
jgi:hypothetical protein